MSVVNSKKTIVLDDDVSAIIWSYDTGGIILEIATEGAGLKVDVRPSAEKADQLADALHHAAAKAAGR